MKYLSLFFIILSMSFITPLGAQQYTIDASHSFVGSSVQRFGAVNVIGRFNDISGTINYNSEDMSQTTAEVVIQVESYSANNAGGESAVKSPAFLDAVNYPEIRFVSTKCYEGEDGAVIVGNLTIHGQTNEVEFPFILVGPVMDMPTQKQSIAISAELTINRQDYGVSFDRKLPNGGSLIGNDVKISLNVLAIAN